MSDKEISSEFSDFLRKGRFSLLNKNIFFDTEFYSLYSIFEQLNEVFNSIKRRIEHKETVQLSSSKFRYLELLRVRKENPEIVYNFTNCDAVIKIIRVRKEYFLYSTHKPSMHLTNYRGNTFVYGPYDYKQFGDCVNDWLVTVKDYVLSVLERLF